MDTHKQHMAAALQVARYALDHSETPVACVFVHQRSNKIVSYGMNATNHSGSGIAHAEFMAIRRLKDRWPQENLHLFHEFLSQCVVYVTVEPCIMCASALKQIGIAKIYFGCGNDRFGGNGTVLSINNDHATLRYDGSHFKQPSIPGLYRREAILLLRYFYVRENDKSPTPRTKLERILDKDTFPSINWSIYMNQKQFGQEFGSNNLIHFDNNDDLNEYQQIDWNIIDSNQDSFIKDLKNKINNIDLNKLLSNIDHKKLKL